MAKPDRDLAHLPRMRLHTIPPSTTVTPVALRGGAAVLLVRWLPGSGAGVGMQRRGGGWRKASTAAANPSGLAAGPRTWRRPARRRAPARRAQRPPTGRRSAVTCPDR